MLGSVAGGWGALKRDPFGILAPAAAALLLQAAGVLAVRWAWDRLDWRDLVVAVIAAEGARTLLTSPARAVMIANGARALDRDARGLPGAPALLLVDGATALLQALAAALLLVPLVLLGVAAVDRGTYLIGACLAAAGLVLGAIAAVAVRAVLAYAPAEVIVARKGPWTALVDGARRGSADVIALTAIVLLGDGLVALGGAACGALALPGYPMAELAVLHRWTRATEAA